MIITHGPISGVHEFSHPSNHMRVLLLVTLKSQLLSSGFVSHAAKGSTRYFFFVIAQWSFKHQDPLERKKVQHTHSGMHNMQH
jgi:hypothetical protein